jgi:glycosyltransferase involved in cell wall biosynthesis
MKIGIMMRAIDQDSGFHLYLDGLVKTFLKLEIPDVSFLLLYRTTKYLGRFSTYKNATEILIKAPHKILWDQLVVPYTAWKYKTDVIFNPKFTVPLISHCPVVMGLQEPAWWAWSEHYEKVDVLYQKLMLPIYARKASHFFPMAQWVIDENRKYIKLPFDNATVTNPGVHEHLKPVTDKKILEIFRAKYNLPENFILSMTRVDNPGMDHSKKWNPSKNPHTALRAFLLCRDKIPHHLVFSGRNVKEYFLNIGFKEQDFKRVHFINFVPFEEIQNIYSLAGLTVVPSYYESFGFTLLGAIACGCPTVVSTAGACSEVVGDAGLYADPDSPEDFANKILMVLKNEDLRKELSKKSIERSLQFTWEKTALLTLQGIQEAIKLNK